MITRFAPSPTGPLHLGHAWSAWTAYDLAHSQTGRFLLRIEDIDRARSKPVWERELLQDLEWLGLRWHGEPVRQSSRMADYGDALDRLWDRGLLYPCTCTRRDIAAALSAPQEGDTPHGPDGPVYPGTCRPSGGPPSGRRPSGVHLRLNMRAAVDVLRRAGLGDGLSFEDTGPVAPGKTRTFWQAFVERIGDIVLARKDFGTSYHLSVVLDDAAQGVTTVVRGADLIEATPIHVLLQHLLGLPEPAYHHHALVRDGAGKRLAKRDDARSIASYRQAGWTPESLRAHLNKDLTAPETAP
ncbi:tRNA glutamyl-Q synthetase [Jannaschia pagri]|uniref:tRNA glutamyl-Q synthetase n=1 Tax=Jannaschia pagri TaxID=2829797 RepID=A0ABQ4NNR1_9RHOB|nr:MULTISPECIES: tRNA glutamyl-Q(34) synthetase GluQRS [unclassified Jannaschia]GIT92183.1 tRNA glutamyl-Q synthetase [Jannaschia sp. AI_61]GIT96018.1 tRNA glutamyl-Q synthetase [Jannaschia sp. AI_62]